MAEIPGATIDFTDYSAPGTPRLINIPDGHGDVTVQDLWDTLSAEAAKLDNLIYKKLIDRPKGGGKAVLSASKSVGITIMLNNVQVKFPDQPGPTYVIKRVTDGNPVAQDHLEAAMEPMANSAFTNWKVEADVSAAIVQTGGSALTAEESTQLKEVWQDAGLDAANEVFISKSQRVRTVAGITRDLTGDLADEVTITRRP